MTKRKYPTVEEVNKVLTEKVLVSSAVTKSTDEYIVSASREFLTQYYAIQTGLITVNEDAKALESSMLMSSLKEEDFTMLLNGALVDQKGKEGTAKLDLSEEEQEMSTQEQKALSKVEQQLSEMSCATIIENTKETLGRPRIYLEDSDFAYRLFMDGYKIGTVVSGPQAPPTKNKVSDKTLYVKKPAELDYSKLNLTAVSGLDTWMLLDCVIKYEAGLLDVLAIPASALPKDLITLFKKVDKWSQGAVELAKNSEHNNTVFNVVDDPFKALFAAL